MTDDQKKRYYEFAIKYLEDCPYNEEEKTIALSGIIEGTKHAHPIGFNLGKEEGKVEGWNEAIEMAIRRLQYSKAYLLSEQINELQKLRK